MPHIDGESLRAWRRARGWDVPETARRLRRAAVDDQVPVHDALVRMIWRCPIPPSAPPLRLMPTGTRVPRRSRLPGLRSGRERPWPTC
jgi:hypothetical protein